MDGRALASILAMLVPVCTAVRAAEKAAMAPSGPQRTVVLDTSGFWRMHHTLRPPLVQGDDGLKPVLLDKLKWLNGETPAPPPDWAKPEFDDGSWGRFPVRREASTPYLARLCLRGKFRVADPDKVRGLELTLEYCGGVIVYLNGRELARGNVSTDPVGMAEPYPPEAFVTDTGTLLGALDKPTAESQRRLGLRLRKLSGVIIPRENLRSGVNVLAVEVVRSPYHKAVVEKSLRGKDPDLNWSTCYLERIQLNAESGEGLVPNAVRPRGFQVWNSDLLAGDFDLDWGDSCEPLRPVKLVGARNGTYSGKVVVGSTQSIRELKATASDLKGEGGSIPAAGVRIRYGMVWGKEMLSVPGSRRPSPYPAQEDLFGAMGETPPGEIPVYQKPVTPQCLHTDNQPAPVFGAVCPVWVTIRAPEDARPGVYKGEITIEARDEKPVKVPVELKVLDWTLPAPQDYRTWIEMVQSPDTLTTEYGMAPWSDKHWEMIARSFAYLNEVGSRMLYIPILARTNLGNEEGMVRWIKKADGNYDYDFSIMDKYLDCAKKYMGQPKLVCFVAWEVYMEKQKADFSNERDRIRALYKRNYTQTLNPELAKVDCDPNALSDETRKKLAVLWESNKLRLEAKGSYMGKGPLVSVLDPATGKIENTHLPSFDEPGSMGLWKSLFDQLKERMRKRDLENVTMLGFSTDLIPDKEDVQFLLDASGGLPWVSHTHHAVANLNGIGKIGYATIVFPRMADDTSLFGWKNQAFVAHHPRNESKNGMFAARWRYRPEEDITGSPRGIGRLGGDYWWAVKDQKGQRRGSVGSRYPEAQWRALDIQFTFLAPGPDGPVATDRLDALREGVQECEARISIEKALTDPALRGRLGDDLAQRAKGLLDERLLYIRKSANHLQLTGPAWVDEYGVAGHSWSLGPSTWQERSEKLYNLAGEVAAKLNLK